MNDATPTGPRSTGIAPRSGVSRFAALRREITSPTLSFLMEAHDGLSAKIVEEAGFRGVWASGLTTSAALGLRDSNEASWTQVLDQLEYMADATSLPILVDGDTGHGNFNNVRRFVRKLGERGLAGVCIEDKLFPKTNSFIGEGQALADIEEFCGRIKAGKDSQVDDGFVLVARVEALIAGHGMAEALRRAEAYHRAGADAILIHSKRSTAEEILAFARAWDNRAPLVIVPTMYYATPTSVYREAGISTVIWANHLLRSAIVAMRETASRIAEDESLMRVEGQVASVKEVFRLVGNAELEEAERRYLPARPSVGAVVLAASGGDLGALTADRPKCMVDIRGRPLLGSLVHTLRESGVRDVTVVRGYRKEAVQLEGVRMVDNDRHAETGELWSLACARNALRGETVIAYGDVLFKRHILDGLLTSEADIVLAVDSQGAAPRAGGTTPRDLVAADRRFSGDYLDDAPAHLRRIASDLPAGEVCGEWMGLARFSARGAGWLREEIAAIEAEGLLERADLPLLLTRLAARHPVRVLYFTGHWLDVDTLGDLAEARNLG
ncbi:phosphoenolpyruvate mutase [Roseicella aerolata]|uniref:phosphoenolpyruvate mutase n=1 Tax=Roseicella aerolata TaxID=2883479 RepID=A0A9X1IGX8_9PROT|nr:phosphoenolpyruvate mutase [Roseicella aerolata]MCB4823979.1 phosphoenolpyruvate mutase [Roseicella aerolata]